MFNCEYCNNKYSSSSSLKLHQKTAKFCIKIQDKNNEQTKERFLFSCLHCHKEFLLKSSYNDHISLCKNKELYKYEQLYQENLDLKNKYSQLENKYNQLCTDINKQELDLQQSKSDYKDLVDKLANKSNTTTNKTYTNYNIKINELFEQLPEFNKENVCNALVNILTHKSILEGTYESNMVKGIKDMVIVTDSSRDKLLIKENGLKCKTNSQEVIRNTFKYYDENNKKIFKEAKKNIPDYTLETANDICKTLCYINNISSAAKDCIEDKQNEFINTISHSLSKEVRIQPTINLLSSESS